MEKKCFLDDSTNAIMALIAIFAIVGVVQLGVGAFNVVEWFKYSLLSFIAVLCFERGLRASWGKKKDQPPKK